MARAKTKLAKTKTDEAIDAIADIVERGVSGTTNWYGDPQTEQNTKLTGASAYGQPGTRTWGEWEKIGRTDEAVAKTLEFILSPIRDAAIDVNPAQHPSIPEDVAVAQADFVRDQINRMEPSRAEFLTQGCETALLYGFGLHEVVLGLGEHEKLPGRKGYVLKRCAERLPSSVREDGWRETLRDDGSRELDYVIQQGQKDLNSYQVDIKIPSDKLLLWTWKRKGQNYRGVSAFRAVWYIAKIREQLLKLIGIALTREGAGIPVATAGENADILTPGQQRKLERLLANLVAHENASVVMPRGWNLSWVFSGGGDKNHIMQVYNDLGLIIMAQLGAQQMALGTNGTGSRSVGEVHDGAAQGYIQSVIELAHGVLNGCGDRRYVGLARKLVEPNWGPMPAYPQVVITPKKPSLAPTVRVAAIAQASAARLIKVTAEDENQLRTDLGMSPREISKEEIAEALKVGTEQEVDTESRSAETLKERLGFNHAKSCKCSKHSLSRGQAQSIWMPWRALRASEIAMQPEQIDRWLDVKKDEFDETMKPIVVAMLVKAVPQIQVAMADGDPSEVIDMPLDTVALEAAIDEWMMSVRAKAKRDVRREVNTAKRQAHRLATPALAPGDPTRPEDMILPETTDSPSARAMYRVLRAQKRDIIKRIVGRVQSYLSREAIDAARTGGDASEVASRAAASVVDAASLRTDAGSMLTKIYNVSRDEAAREVGATKAEYSAILDSDTCAPCMQMDGKVFAINSTEYEANLPPNRECEGLDNCRCLMAFLPDTNEELQ